MTNKRYSKFQSEITGLFCIADENHKETFCGMDNEYNCMRIVNILNQKEERIEALESAFIKDLESMHNDCIKCEKKYEKKIKELQKTIDTIAKDYEISHGMDIRNAEWFTAW